jgi:hypothetical protein
MYYIHGYGVFLQGSNSPTAVFKYKLAAMEFIDFNHMGDCAEIKEGTYHFDLQ